MDQKDFNLLLSEYLKLWNNRKLASVEFAEQTLKSAIISELQDENSHPRIRKTHYQKYFTATKRILDSRLTNEYKLELIQLHVQCLMKIEEQKESRL